MTFKQDTQQELNRLMGQILPQSVSVTSSHNLRFVLNVTQVDTLSCALQYLEVAPPPQSQLDFNTLQTWSRELSKKLTYLLEQLAPIEVDPSTQKIQIRSSQPAMNAGNKEYYEMLLSVSSSGCLKLERFRIAPNQKQRTPMEMIFTREVLLRLMEDIETSFVALTP